MLFPVHVIVILPLLLDNTPWKLISNINVQNFMKY